MQKQTAAYTIKEAALMFEAGASANLDYIIGVYAPQHLLINRVIKRNHSTREQVLERMNNQIDETIKMKLCDFIIINDEQQAILPQILHLHKKFLALAPNSIS
jgi:dephospho-CoA kinase